MITLFHDYSSPASMVAVHRADRLAAEGLEVDVVGFEVIGIDAALPMTADVRADAADVADEAAREGLCVQPPAFLPPTARCHVLEELASARGEAARWRAAAYAALWHAGQDISNAKVLAELAVAVGLEPEPTRAALADSLAVVRFRQRCAQFRREGVGGVPTILASRTLVPGLLPEHDLRLLASL